ncbi:MAG: type II secretion system F family protein [Hyphomicrobiales bacterium]|nr:type II secretion system F family protein [Hyphomicrobiales bacterium]
MSVAVLAHAAAVALAAVCGGCAGAALALRLAVGLRGPSEARRVIRPLVRRQGLQMNSPRVICAALALASCAGCLAMIAGASSGAALLAAAASGFAPLAAQATARRRRERAVRADFQFALSAFARAAETGLPLRRCLELAAGDGEGAARRPLAVLSAELSAMAPQEALARFSAATGVPETRFFALALALHLETGGGVALVAKELTAAVKAQVQFRAKLRTLTAEARASAWLIGGLPFAVAGAAAVAAPDHLAPLWSDPRGTALVAGALAWMGVGAALMRLMIRASRGDEAP